MVGDDRPDGGTRGQTRLFGNQRRLAVNRGGGRIDARPECIEGSNFLVIEVPIFAGRNIGDATGFFNQ